MNIAQLSGIGNLLAGPNAVNWQIADFNGDGVDEIAQLWDNGGTLAVNLYTWGYGTLVQ